VPGYSCTLGEEIPGPYLPVRLAFGVGVRDLQGLLDTGADQTTIPLVTAQELRLRQIGDSDVKGATGVWESRPLYAVDISFGGFAFPSVVVMAIDYPVVLIAAILETARRVIPHPDAAFGQIFETTDRAPTRLDVVLRSGVRHTLDVDYPRGSPSNPATRDELQAEFDTLAARALPQERLGAIKAALFALEEAPSIHDVTTLCVHRTADARHP